MPAEFVPFLPGARARAASDTATEPKFKAVVCTDAAHSAHAPAPAREPEHEFKVELKRDGERVSQIVVQCHCGERIQIDCEY
jgi:hypothetical protein